MKAITLNAKEAVTSNHELNGRVDWILPIKRVMRFFGNACKSDWEKKTGLCMKVSFSG